MLLVAGSLELLVHVLGLRYINKEMEVSLSSAYGLQVLSCKSASLFMLCAFFLVLAILRIMILFKKQPNSSEWYPTMKFKLLKDMSGKKSNVITVEVNENLPKKFESKNPNKVLPEDYWDFIAKDPKQQKSHVVPRKIILSPYQVMPFFFFSNSLLHYSF